MVDKDIFLSVGGIDFVNLTREVSFSQTNQTHCVDISILMDADQELNESFSVELTLQYAPLNIALDTYTVTIVDSGEFGMYAVYYCRIRRCRIILECY